MQNIEEKSGHLYSQRVELMLRKILTVLSDDPRIRILKLLAEHPSDNTYVSFRTIARRVGVNYTKLRQYLSQLERAGLLDSVKINTANGNNEKNSSKGYTYYKLKHETRDVIKKILDQDKVSIYYPYLILITLSIIATYI